MNPGLTLTCLADSSEDFTSCPMVRVPDPADPRSRHGQSRARARPRPAPNIHSRAIARPRPFCVTLFPFSFPFLLLFFSSANPLPPIYIRPLRSFFSPDVCFPAVAEGDPAGLSPGWDSLEASSAGRNVGVEGCCCVGTVWGGGMRGEIKAWKRRVALDFVLSLRAISG